MTESQSLPLLFLLTLDETRDLTKAWGRGVEQVRHVVFHLYQVTWTEKETHCVHRRESNTG